MKVRSSAPPPLPAAARRPHSGDGAHFLPATLPSQATPRPSLHGKWVKDPKASDMQAMARAIDLMRLGGIQARPRRGRRAAAGRWAAMHASRKPLMTCVQPASCDRLILPTLAAAPAPRPCPQKHCALNLINGLEIAAAAEGEVAVRFLTDTWVVSLGWWEPGPGPCCFWKVCQVMMWWPLSAGQALHLRRALRGGQGDGDEPQVGKVLASAICARCARSPWLHAPGAPAACTLPCRDKRRGSQRAKTLRLEPDHMHVHITWGGSLPGELAEAETTGMGACSSLRRCLSSVLAASLLHRPHTRKHPAPTFRPCRRPRLPQAKWRSAT